MCAGQPGSVLVTDHVYRVRPACTSTDSTLQLINKDQKRSTRFPLPGKDQRQVLGIVNATYQVGRQQQSSNRPHDGTGSGD